MSINVRIPDTRDMADSGPAAAQADDQRRLTDRIRGLLGAGGEGDMGQRFLMTLTAGSVAIAIAVLAAGVAWGA